ncbi:unnamed protein product, partial [Rhizoctonia solani]
MYRRMDEPGFHRGGFGMDDIAANDTTQQYQNAAQKSYDTFDHPERSASSHRSSLRTAPSTFTPPLPSPLSSAAQQNHSQAQYFMRFIPSRPPSLNRGTYSYSQAQTQSPTFPGPEGHAPYLRTKAPEDASSFDFATQLEMEFRRLELVWQETGKQWKDKHGAPLARSQDMAFRRKIEGGIGIKDDSPIDKEWRDMWKNTNGDWAESEARWRKEVMHKRTASRNEDSYFHTAHADSRNASVADDDKVTNAIIFHFEKEMEKRRRRAERKQYEEMRQDYHNGAGQHLYTSATDPSHPQHVPSRYSYEETEHDISRPKGRQRSPSTMSHPEFHNSRPSLSPSINTHDVPQAGQTDGPLSIVEEVAKQEREQAALARRIQELRAAVEVNEGPKLTRPIPAPVLEQERKRGQDKNKESKLKDGHQRGPSATPNPEAHSPHPSLFPSDMAFRRKIEGGIGIKDDSPIDKEWRDMWKNTNGDWAESEARWRKEVTHKRTASRNEDSYFHTAHADSRNASVADDDKVTNAIIFHFEKEMEKRRRRAERKQYEEMRQDYHNGAGQHLYTSATDPSHPQHVPSRYSYEETEHDISRPKGRQRSPSTMSHPEFHNSRPSLSPSINTHDVPQAGQTDGPLSIVEEVAKQEREQAALARRIQELRAAVEVNEGPKLTRPIPAPVLEQERKRGQDKNKESKLKDGHQRGPSATPNPEAHSPHPSLFPSVSTRDVPQAGQSDNPLSIVEEVA